METPLEVRTVRASASLLSILGVAPAMGRDFLPAEDLAGHDGVAILAYDFWQRQFGGDRGVLGRPLTLDGRQFTIIGILPHGFAFPFSVGFDLLTPLGKDEARKLQRHEYATVIFDVIGRLRPGVKIEQARAEMAAIQAHLPNMLPWHPRITIEMLPLRDHLFGSAKEASLVLLGAAVFLLLIACANVGNLLLVRLAQRDREFALRAALGGSRTRLVRQLLTESALLGTVACGAGIFLASLLRRPLVSFSPYHLPGLERLPIDFAVFAFAIVAGMVSTLLFGTLPAFRATGFSLTEAIRGGAAGLSGSKRSMRLLSFIAAGEIAVTLVLACGAGLMLESFWRMRYGNLGFRPEHLVAATLHLTAPRYRDYTQRAAFIGQLLERASALPGVQQAAITTAWELPPGRGRATNAFQIEGRIQGIASGHRPIARFQQVSSGYFNLMGIPLLRGKTPRDSDREVVVNRALAEKYFRGENPIGHRLIFGEASGESRTIVGIVGDVKTSGLASPPEPAVYYPYRAATPSQDVGLVLRSGLSVNTLGPTLRKTVASIDPNQPLATIESMADRLSASVAGPRFTAALLLAFAILALLLGIIGVYGVMACRVRWQTRELAVRQALGARPSDVLQHVMWQGLGVILPGIAAGVIGAVASTRVMAGLLYDTPPTDAATLATVALMLALTALTACWFPAMRAARLDPAATLRQD